MTDLPTGDDTKIEIRCSEETFKKWAEIDARITPSGTYEDTIHQIISTFQANPRRFGVEEN